jgi:hypothetical protein
MKGPEPLSLTARDLGTCSPSLTGYLHAPVPYFGGMLIRPACQVNSARQIPFVTAPRLLRRRDPHCADRAWGVAASMPSSILAIR